MILVNTPSKWPFLNFAHKIFPEILLVVNYYSSFYQPYLLAIDWQIINKINF